MIRRCLILGVALTVLQGCKHTESPFPASSAASMKLPGLDELFPIPRPKSSFVLDGVQKSMAESAVKTMPTLTPHLVRLNTEAMFVGQLKRVGGMPSYQSKRLLTDLVSDRNGLCAGASCRRVMGIRTSEVDGFIGDVHSRLRVNKELLKPENSSLRRVLIGSVQPAEEPTMGAVKRGPLEVVYKAVKDSYEKGVDVSTVSGPGRIKINVTPDDLRHAKSFVCDEKQCEAVIPKPVNFDVSVPLSLNSNVHVAYKKTADKTGLQVEENAVVGAHTTPVNLGEVIKVGVDFSAEVNKGASTANKMMIKNVNCAGSVRCDLPMVSISAAVDKTGLEFDASLNVEGMNSPLIKVMPNLPHLNYKLKFADIPKNVQKVKDQMMKIDAAGKRIVRPDIDWDSFDKKTWPKN